MLAAGPATAADGTWINLSGGNWSEGLNWAGGTVADGAGSRADFSTLDLQYTFPAIILDGPRVVGRLVFGDSDPVTYGGWFLTNSTLTLSNSAATPVIQVNPITAPSGSLDSTNDVILGSALAGGQGFIKQGQGTLTLTAANSMGPVQIDEGTIALGNATALGAGNQEVRFNGGGVRVWNGGPTFANTNRIPTTGSIISSNGNYDSFNGPWIGSGTMLVHASGRLTVGGGSASAFAGFTGAIDLSDSPNGCNLRMNLGGASIYDFSRVTFNLGTNAARFSFRTTTAGTIVRIGALAGDGTGARLMSSEQSAGVPLTWEIGALNLSTRVAGNLQEYTSGRTAHLVKVGTGTLTLAGLNNTYTGNTTVSNGVLALSGSGALTATPRVLVLGGAVFDVSGRTTVWGLTAAQTLAGSGVITGEVATAAGIVSPGDSIGTLNFSNNLSLTEGVTNLFEIAGPGANDAILVAGNLTLNSAGGGVAVRVVPTGAVIPNGTYTLFKWGGTLPAGDVNSLVLQYPAQAGTLTLEQDLGAKEIRLKVAGVAGAAQLTWRGDGAANKWDFSTANWREGGGAVVFKGGDNVTFDDSGSNNVPVDLAAAVNPGLVLVRATKDFAFSATAGGRITGSAGLVKTNSGRLTITTDNDYSGDTIIAAGVLQIGDGVNVGGSLGTGNLTNNGTLVFDRPDEVTNNSAIRGVGLVVQRGAGLLTLGGNNSFSGGTTISNNSTLLAASATALGTGPLKLAGGTLSSPALAVDNAIQVTADSTINNTASGSVQINTSNLTRTAGLLTLAGSGPIRLNAAGLTYNGPVDLQTTLQSYNMEGVQTFNGVISGSGVFQRRWPGQNFTGTTLFNAANTFSGGTLLREGSIGFGTSTVSAFPPTIDSGPIGTGPLNQDNATYTAVFASGGARTVANDIVLNSAGQAFVIKGDFDLTLSGAVNLGGADKIIQVENTAKSILSGEISNGNLIKTGNGTLCLDGNNNASSTVASAGTLGGQGTCVGPVTVAAGATLAPGTSIGTFTINSDLTIAGNIAIEVNKSQSPSNDLVVVSGVLTNASNGALTVANLGPGLAVGDKFKPFSKAVLNGSALTVTGAGAVWANNLQVDGSISVAALSQTKPVITSTVVVGGLLVFSGTNGTAGANYYVLSSTNVATPLAAWTRDATNSFGPGGVFAVTNAILPGVPVKFHTLQLP